MNDTRDGTVRWIRRGGGYRLARVTQRATPSPLVASRIPAYQRPTCPALLLTLAALTPLCVGLLAYAVAVLR